MDNEKLFEFMEKIYSELQTTRTEMQKGFKSVNDKIDGLEKQVNKNTVKLESLENKVDIIAEVQQNHMKQNESNHIEIVEIFNEKIDLTQSAVKNLSRVK